MGISRILHHFLSIFDRLALAFVNKIIYGDILKGNVTILNLDYLPVLSFSKNCHSVLLALRVAAKNENGHREEPVLTTDINRKFCSTSPFSHPVFHRKIRKILGSDLSQNMSTQEGSSPESLPGHKAKKYDRQLR